MNPVGGDFGGYTFSRQFKDRLAFLKVSSTIEEWLAFANKAGLPLYVRNMISEQPGFSWIKKLERPQTATGLLMSITAALRLVAA